MVGKYATYGDDMKKIMDPVLRDLIEDEKNFDDYIFNDADQLILKKMLNEINKLNRFRYHFRYLAELDGNIIIGAGDIVLKYINEFQSESTRAYLIEQLVCNNVDDCDKIVLDLYKHFKASTEYRINYENGIPTHIAARYDNAFCKLKPARIVGDLIILIDCPADIFYLPFTIQFLSKRKDNRIKETLFYYLNHNDTIYDYFKEKCQCTDEQLSYIVKQIQCIAINSLRYFPEPPTIKLIEHFLSSEDKDVVMLAQKVLRQMK